MKGGFMQNPDQIMNDVMFVAETAQFVSRNVQYLSRDTLENLLFTIEIELRERDPHNTGNYESKL